MSAIICSLKPEKVFPKQASELPTVAETLIGARSADDSGRSGRDTERSSTNSLLLMLNSTKLTPLDTKVLNEIKLRLNDENNKLLSNKRCFAGWNASTIKNNQDKIGQINWALENPESVKVEVKQASFSRGLSDLKIHEIQRSMYLVNGNQGYLGMNKLV